MPIRPAVQGLLKHAVMFTTAGEVDNAQLTLWTYKASYPVSAARLDYERAAINSWLTDMWAVFTGNHVTATSVKTWDFGTTVPTPLGRFSFAPPVGGGLVGTRSAPLSVAGVVALRTQAVGSNVRNRLNGRVYHVGIMSCVNDSLGTPSALNLGAVYDDLLSRLRPAANANSGQWSIVSWRSGGAWRAVPLVIAINHCLGRSAVATQRRRLRHAGAYTVGA